MPSIATLDVPYGYVWGQFIVIGGDTTADEDDKPDATASNGTITFIPAKPIVTSSVNGLGVIGIIQRYPYSIDADGVLRDPAGNSPVAFMCGEYLVSFGLSGMPLKTITINITTDNTVSNPLDLGKEYERQVLGL